MNVAIRRCVFVAALTLRAMLAYGQDELGPYERYQRGIAALEAKDAARALPDLEAAAFFFRRDPDVLSALAKARALTGDADGATAALSRAVALGYGAGADTDPAFGSLADRPAFRALLPSIVANGRPVGSARVAFTLNEADLIPEGIAWDPGTRRLFVGSLAKNKIVAISPDGRVSDFVPSGRDGLQRVLGMKVDAARKSLWVCSAEADAPGGSKTRASTLFRFDLATGKTLRKIPSPPGGTHLFNDIAIEKDGGLFLTDSEEGTVYRLRAGRDALEVFQAPGRFFYPNGIALSDDGRFLYVAHVLGVSAWELGIGRSADGVGAVTFDLPSPDDVTLVGIDGLSFHRGGLVAVQNGMEPNRVASFPLAPSLDRVTGDRVLERGNKSFEIPTTGAVAGNSYYVIANAQLRSLGPEGVKDPEKRKPVVILEIDLPR
ncbi:MAG: SMP-30/gluconolactonase/LRE family protein [Thermoanaerobaculia bacterium]